MKRKELEEIIKSAFIAEMGSDAQYDDEKDYSFVAEIEVEEDLDEMLARLSEKEESLDDILAGLMGESISEENIDSETKKILNPLEDLRALAEKGDDEKFKSLINYGITLVNKYMIAKIKDGKTLNLDVLKAATMELLPKAKAKGGYLDDGDLNAFMKFSRNPYLGTDPYLAEDLYEAEEEEEEQTDVTIDAKEKTTDGGEEKTNDSIVIDKKIVSLSSLPNETRKILDSLETLRAQAEEFGDQKFITQVGNTITFFTRDFVVAGEQPTMAKVDEEKENLNEGITFPMWNKIK